MHSLAALHETYTLGWVVAASSLGTLGGRQDCGEQQSEETLQPSGQHRWGAEAFLHSAVHYNPVDLLDYHSGVPTLLDQDLPSILLLHAIYCTLGYIHICWL